MRVLFISQLFDPENSIKGLEFAKRLQALGHDVEVVTTYPSYPHGRIFQGYQQRWKQVDILDGVKVVRLPTYISHGKSAIKRMMSYASFGITASLYSLFGAKRSDVIYAYYPPVAVGLVACFVGFFKRVPYVYDVQDLWPEALVATGMLKKGRATHWVDKLCGLIYRNAARIAVQSDGYRQALLKKNVPSEKIQRIFNWCDESRAGFQGDSSPVIFERQCFNILYAGNLGAAQALEHVIEAAHLLQKSGDKKIKFTFVGAGMDAVKLKKMAENFSLSNVNFFPQVSVDQVGAILARADALLVHLADDPVFEITIPSKTQAYLMAGKPILMAVKGEAARIIEDAGAGMIVQPCQPALLAQAAREMAVLPTAVLSNMGKSGRNFYQEKMSMDHGVKTIDHMLKIISSKQ